MKKINLIERLLSYSHEKQSPQRFVRYAAMLIMLLTLGVGQMWAVPGFRKGNIYFDKSGWTTNASSIQFVVGKSDYSSVYNLGTTITNTQLVKGWCSNGDNWWNGTSYFAVIGNGSGWGSGSWGSSNLTNASHYTGTNNSVDINSSSKPYLCTKASASNGAALTITEKTAITDLNYTLTLKYAVSTNGGTAAELTSGYVPATLTCSTYKFVSAYDEVSSSSLANTLTKNGSRYSSTASAAHTASTTFAVSSIDDDYTFLGWYTAADGGTELSTNTSYTTYLPTANATIYARFSHENKHTVTINRYCTSTSSLINSTSQKVGEITYSEISAPVISGYTFANWSYENGISVKSGDKTSSNPIHVKTLSSGTYTLTANYTEDLTSPWTLKGGTNLTGDDWSISHAMTKKTGHSTESVAYYTLNITSTNSGVSTGTASWSFKLYNSGWYGLFASGESYWWTSSTSANQSMNGSDKNIQVCANALGEYEVKVDWSSGNKVTVSFPTSYVVNFGKGGTYGSSTVTAKYSNVSFSTGTKVQSGKKVVFTYSEATGYHFVEWNSQSDGNGETLSTAASYEHTVGSTNNVYAIFAANTWTVTLNAEGGTAYGMTESVSVTYNATTNLTSAITKPSTHPAFSTFGGYWTGRGGTGVQLIDASGNWIKGVSGYTGTSGNNPTWVYNNNITLYAKWTLYYSLAHYPTLDNTPETIGRCTVTYKSSALTGFSASTRSGYTCQGYYTTTNAAGGGQKVITSGGALYYNGPGDTIVDSSNRWIYATRRLNSENGARLYPRWTANTYTVTFDPDDDDRVGDATNVQDVVSVTFNTNDYHVGETPVSTVKVPVLDGYTFGGYYTVKNGGGAQIVDADGVWQASKTYYTDGSKNWIKADNVTLYAKWTAKTYTLTLDAGTNGGHILGALGDATSETVEITMGENYPLVGKSGRRSGYVFDGWYTSPSGGTKKTSESIVATASDHTLYAQYIERNYVYFYNNVGWENVYVTYSAYWDESVGTGNYGKKYRKMTLVDGTTNIYYDEIPSEIIDNWSGTNAWIAFDNTGFSASDGVGTYGNFTSGKVIHRRDFDSYATMFVPNSSKGKDFTKNTGPGADYYCTTLTADKDNEDKVKDYRYIDRGYWTRYNNLYSGYVLKGSWDGSHDYYFTRSYTDHADTTTVVLHLDAGTNYTFKVYKHCRTTNYNNSWFSKSASPYTITSAACKDVVFNTEHAGNYIGAGNDKDVTITTTDEGDYTFKLITDKTGVLKLTVAYPKALDTRDHRLVYTWNDGTPHTRISPRKLIPNTGRTPMTMFIHKPANVSRNSLKLQRWNGSSWEDAYTFTLTDELIPNNGVYYIEPSRVSETIEEVKVEPYTGKYYIRTDATSGGWKDYSNIAFGDNSMTYSAYALTQTLSDPYSHYHCIYVDNTSTSVAFTVATEWSPSITDTLTTDALVTGSSCHLPEAANVRFMWNSNKNDLHRAYLKSAQGENARFLVLHGKADDMIFDKDGNAIAAAGSLYANELQFEDKGDWIYEVDLQAKPGSLACITAKFGGADRYLVGDGDVGGDNWETILGGDGDDQYSLHGIYDFKTNRLMMMWTPSGTINDDLADIDMLWLRHGNSAASQITIGTGSLTDITAVAALEFRYNELIGRATTWTATNRQYMKFMVSFPFDVNVSDIFGLEGAVYGREYIIQMYNGARRAEHGYYELDGSFWETLTTDSVMHANQGYSVIMDNDYMNNASASIWHNKSAGSSIYLYFPATEKMDIEGGNPTSDVAKHLSFDKSFVVGGKDKNHLNTDSHWNLIGAPLFHNYFVKASTNDEEEVAKQKLSAYYIWNASDNSWSAEPVALTGDDGFNAMSCIMVQWHGTVTWSTVATDYLKAAPRRTSEDETINYLAQLDLIYNDNVADKAYVELKDGAIADYALCEDMNKMTNGGKPNIYFFAGNYEVAYSQVPVQSQTIPVGVIIRRTGTYTFSMPSNFSGTVTLVDKFANTRTNLAMEDYEVYLEKGTIDDRFELEININKTPTAIDGAEDGSGSLKDGKAHKFIMNGVMYILENGRIYDAQGNRVK